MKKAMRAALVAVCTMLLAVSLVFAVGCSKEDSEQGTISEQVYAQAVALGYEGTYDEFIALVSGKDGVGVKSAAVNEDGELILTLSDNSTVNAGKVRGEDGASGQDGADGATWLVGSGIPTADKGKDGDLYLDSAAYNVYQKVSGEWTLIGSIKGEDGQDGADGADGTNGQDGQDGEDGTDGANGQDGADGATWLVGSGVPTADKGKDGDLYLDSASYDIYQKVSGEWNLIGNIKGEGATPEQTDGFAYYEITENGETVGYAVGAGENRRKDTIVIPSEYNGLPVTEIAYEGFAGCRDMQITVPASIVYVDVYAFRNTENIEFIFEGENIFFADMAFENTNNIYSKQDIPKGFEGDYWAIQFNQAASINVEFYINNELINSDTYFENEEGRELFIGPSDPERGKFEYWQTKDGTRIDTVQQLFEEFGSGKAELYAVMGQYEEISQIEVTFVAEPGSLDGETVRTYYRESMEELPFPNVPEQYQFQYWLTEQGEIVKDIYSLFDYANRTQKTAFTLTAKYIYQVESITVTLNAGEGTVNGETFVVLQLTESDSLPEAIASDAGLFLFDGWHCDEMGYIVKDAHELFYFARENEVTEFTLHAQYREMLQKISVWFTSEYGFESGEKEISLELVRGESATFPDAICPEEMNFIGWRTEFGMVETAEDIFAIIDEYGSYDLYIYAMFVPTDARQVTVTFYVDGAEYLTRTYYEGIDEELPRLEDDSDRYFESWQTEDGKYINWAGEAFEFGETLNLYAKFSYTRITVYFDPGAGKMDSLQIEYDRELSGGDMLPEPVPENETLIFAGWYMKDNAEVTFSQVDSLFAYGPEVYLVAKYVQTGEHFGVFYYQDAEYSFLMNVAGTVELMEFRTGKEPILFNELYTFEENVLTVSGYTFTYDAEKSTFTDSEGRMLQRAEGGKLYMRVEKESGAITELTEVKDESWTVLTDTSLNILDENDPSVWYMIAMTEEEFASWKG